MRLVVDTSVLFAALIKDSMTRWMLMHFDGELLTIGFSDKEIKKYKDYILEKSETSELEFNAILGKIKERLIIINDNLILRNIDEGIKIMEKIDIKDAPFVAAALATKGDIWSDDAHFQQQKKVRVWTTKELAKFI
ncbi:hypothetical protein HY485_03370 [Candidatus Woesearchaeota archaeon]|nr:hypothetical protein [Candidatus Woesearchaeota archaeon]